MNIQEEKETVYNYLKEVGITVGMDWEVEPNGEIFADIHTALPQSIKGGGASYLTYDKVEVTIMYIANPTTYKAVRTAIKMMAKDYIVTNETATLNNCTVTLQGKKVYNG